MVEYVEYLFVRPRAKYRRRVDRNAQRSRVKQATAELEKASLADKVATAVQKEGSTTPRSIKVMIMDGKPRMKDGKMVSQNG